MTMPFGEYRGCPLDEIPTGYLQWLLTIDLRPYTQLAVEEKLSRRDDGPRQGRRDGGGQPNRSLTPVVDIGEWYRRVPMRYHPERAGGSTSAMQAINAAKDLLEDAEMTADALSGRNLVVS